jgi:epoxyqueuosine reductase
MSSEENYRRAEAVLAAEGARKGLKHALGVAPFKAVYDTLLPTQKETLRGISGGNLDRLMVDGSVISIAFAYWPYAIEAIASGSEGHWDKERWNVYSHAYARLNDALNYTSRAIADEIKGIAIPATIDSYTKADTVEEYYATRVSHRVAAELSGVGWRGKHELIISPVFGPAIRLASVLTTEPITRTPKLTTTCGDCTSCQDVCPILKNKAKLVNYREQCRQYLANLALEDEVCGKCIKACMNEGKYASQFHL